MSRSRNGHDNAVAERFVQRLKGGRIRRRIYLPRDDARADVLDYIARFYTPKRRGSNNDTLSPIKYERQYLLRKGNV